MRNSFVIALLGISISLPALAQEATVSQSRIQAMKQLHQAPIDAVNTPKQAGDQPNTDLNMGVKPVAGYGANTYGYGLNVTGYQRQVQGAGTTVLNYGLTTPGIGPKVMGACTDPNRMQDNTCNR